MVILLHSLPTDERTTCFDILIFAHVHG